MAKPPKIAVIGDAMVDVLIQGESTRLSPEGPIPVVKETSTDMLLGGAANVWQNCISLGGEARLFTVLGYDPLCEFMCKRIPNLSPIVSKSRKTTRKTRVFAGNHPVCRIDDETTKPIDGREQDSLFNDVTGYDPDCIVFSDYDKGVLVPELCQRLIQWANEHGRDTVADWKSQPISKFRGVGVLKMNRDAMPTCPDDLALELDARMVVVTNGRNGAIAVSRKNSNISQGFGFLCNAIDVAGAGDVFTAAVAVEATFQRPWEEILAFANAAAGASVECLGTVAISRNQALAILSFQKRSGFVNNAPVTRARVLKANGRKIVFTNGVFDDFHAGHFRLLKEAARCGDVLVVAVDGDELARANKGCGRPVNGEHERCHNVMAAQPRAIVAMFHDRQQLLQMIEAIQPDVIVKGSDYTTNQVVGREFCKEVVIVPRSEDSTTNEIRKRSAG